MDRFKTIIRRTLMIFLSISSLILLLLIIHFLFHPFDSWIASLKLKIMSINQAIKKEVLTGVSIGALILCFIAIFFPLFIKKTDKAYYLSSLRRGIIATSIFYISHNIYTFLENISESYLFIFMVIIAIVTFILIEVALSFIKRDHEVTARSSLLASIVAGLTFGILLKIFQYLFKTIQKLFV